MSLHKLSNNIQSQGRGNDSMLVHMSPREVGGLQQLAKSQGGSLSVNPKTGLVEAGFLEQALPIVAAAAATYFTAGAAAPALMSAGMGATSAGILAGAGAGALIGGGSAAIQGKDATQGALYGGLGGAIAGGTGAYAGAPNVFSGASAAAPATDVAAQTAAQTTTQGAVDAGIGAGTSGYGEANALLTNPAAVPPPTAPQTAFLNPGDVEAQAGGFYGGAAPANPYAGMTNQQITASTGIQPPPAPPPTYFQDSNKLTQAGILALPGLGAAAGAQPSQPGQEEYDESSPYRWRLASNFQGSTPVRPNPYYKATYAAGGLASLQGTMYPQSQQVNTQFATPTQMPTSAEVVASDYEPVSDPATGQAMRMAGGGNPADQKKKKPTLTSAAKLKAMDPYEAAIAGLSNAEYGAQMPTSGIDALKPRMQLGQLNLACGGISDLGGYSDGGRMLKGRGDGMSDSIPASIGGKQPARLADGEFVVPADVVSHLGNGSTDAGAKRLYAMMDKVRKARTGKKKQAPAVNPKRLMPA